MDAATNPLAPSPSPSPSSIAVLVVDDDEHVRLALSDVLTEEGYDVYLAPDGAPALRRLREHPHGMVVLLDIAMPGMDGAKVLQAVVAEAPLAQQHVFIAMATGPDWLPRPLVPLLAYLEVHVLVKPLDITRMAKAVAYAAQRLSENGSRAP